MACLTYQQMRLMELIDTTRRAQRLYLVAPAETDDARACADAGLLDLGEDGSARLTADGQGYIIDLNTSTSSK